jgi:hypothetical protein
MVAADGAGCAMLGQRDEVPSYEHALRSPPPKRRFMRRLTRRLMRRFAAVTALLLAAGALGDCSGGINGFGSFGKKPAEIVVNPDPYPANYRKQVATLLTMNLHDRADFRGAFIAAPALKPVAESQTPHYVVCVLLTGHNDKRSKAVVYLEGRPNEFIDATPQQCDGVAYQPFAELDYEQPDKYNGRQQVGSGDPSTRDVP